MPVAVVKLGSSIVAEESGELRLSVVARIVEEVAALHRTGVDVVVVTSGAIVRAVIALSDALGMTTVAEGVEQPVQQHFLAAQGCPLSQGRLFGDALPVAAMTERLAGERA